jgi:hypothetical protein
MRYLTIGDTKLYLRYLLTDGLDDLRASATGRLYEPRLRAKKQAIDALPEAALSKAPFAGELGAADGAHDGLGGAVYYVCQAIAAHPGLSVEVKQTAASAMATFIPQLGNLRDPFADEAAVALANRPKLAAQKAALKAVQMPGGGSLFEWVKGFVDAGDAIDGLLRRRAAVMATTEDASGNGPLRATTLGLLSRFREALRDELADDSNKLPADHEARLFAYFDKLATDRASSSAKGGRETPDAADAGTPEDGAAPTPAVASPVAPA